MTTSQTLLPLAGGLVALAVAVSASSARGAGDAGLRAGLERLASRTIFFGHQSVGGNILEGLQELAAEGGVPLRLTETQGPAALAPSLSHAYIGQNGNPELKLQAFEQAMKAPGKARVDIALMKFCYVDFGQGTDAPALFARYQAALGALRAVNPETVFVHVTVPLTAPEGMLKALAKRVLGKESSAGRNAVREQYNALLRAAYQGREPLFDLAALEATAPDGRTQTVTWKGKDVPAMAGAYTDDGGHLNPLGRRRVARALVDFLASLPAPASAAPGSGAR